MSTIKIAMNGMGYRVLPKRNCCGNCKHVVRLTPTTDVTSNLRCTEGGFYVLHGAICDRWMPLQTARKGAVR